MNDQSNGIEVILWNGGYSFPAHNLEHWALIDVIGKRLNRCIYFV